MQEPKLSLGVCNYKLKEVNEISGPNDDGQYDGMSCLCGQKICSNPITVPHSWKQPSKCNGIFLFEHFMRLATALPHFSPPHPSMVKQY